ncbi:hypothetical protein CGI16_23220 [Vibrio parahaemolyticus]|uniref:hypothetical protein n=1 Tax=Vibrio parahaemolyticus TaxID=670 RepID=UPI0011214032|nr:hypothetical protein [Vibrio parahaemolyticus]TOK32764.1 hypothetical protein CGI19_20195 [Vibrio parahaemolyticus]TOK51933.1 hypothetical protein CGI16_23220 [Vibrio parahaemolyticus]
MKTGTNRETGAEMGGIPYLRQRLYDVINTPLGSLVGRRDFGSRFYELVDRNVDARFHMEAYIRLAEAINNPMNGLDDFNLSEMVVEREGPGHYSITISGTTTDGQQVEMDGIIYG